MDNSYWQIAMQIAELFTSNPKNTQVLDIAEILEKNFSQPEHPKLPDYPPDDDENVEWIDDVKLFKKTEDVKMEKYLLSHTPTADNRIEVDRSSGMCTAKLIQEMRFDFDVECVVELVWFIQSVKDDKLIRHTYTSKDYRFEYDPQDSSLGIDKFVITHKSNGRTINIALATAYKLLDALDGKTERLVKEE